MLPKAADQPVVPRRYPGFLPIIGTPTTALEPKSIGEPIDCSLKMLRRYAHISTEPQLPNCQNEFVNRSGQDRRWTDARAY